MPYKEKIGFDLSTIVMLFEAIDRTDICLTLWINPARSGKPAKTNIHSMTQSQSQRLPGGFSAEAKFFFSITMNFFHLLYFETFTFTRHLS